MSVTAPPRPPRPARSNEPLDREEIEALVEALIEEARRETRRRHRQYWALAALVAFVGVVLLILLEGGAASQTASPALATRLSVPASAASSKIAFIREPGGGYAGVLWVMNPDGSGKRKLSAAFGGMRWSPDGQKIAFTTWGDGFRTSDIYVSNADGSGQEKLTSDPGWYSGLTWAPDGRQVAFTRHDTPSTRGNSGIYVMNADGSGQERLLVPGYKPPSGYYADYLAWSPVGNRIAFMSQRDGNREIYVVNANGSGLRRLTRSVLRDRFPVWSPDGRRLAFEHNWQVWVMNADGGGQRRPTRNAGRNVAPAWSPDGQRIAFERHVGRTKYGPCLECGRASTFQVYVMNANGTQARKLAQNGAQPVWSPDGRKIAFTELTQGDKAFQNETNVIVMNADGSGLRNLTRDAGVRDSQPVWSPAQKK